MSTTPRALPTIDEIRTRNGFKVLVAAFVTVLIAFNAALYLWSSHVKDGAIASADIVALLGVITGTVGALVGSYFGVSSANSAKDSINAQLTSANTARDSVVSELSNATELNTRLSAKLSPDIATPIVNEHMAGRAQR